MESMDNAAAAQLRSFVDRITRLYGERDAINSDIADVLAESKSSGYDKTAVRKLATDVHKRSKGEEQALDEAEQIAELYRAAYFGTVPAIARTGTGG